MDMMIMTQYLTEIKVLGWSLVLKETMYTGARRCVCTCGTPPGVFSAGRILLALIGHQASVGGSVSCADWSCVDGAVDISPGGFWIDYIRPGLEDGQSIVAAQIGSCWHIRSAGYQVLLQKIAEHWTMDANGLSVVDNRAGITFEVELYVPWDAPEAVVDVSSADVVPLRNVPDVIGLVGRRESVVESRVLQGRDARSVRVLVPDCRGLDQNFHDVIIVDMGELPESHVSMPELSDLMHKWPPALINHMMWRQRELEEMRKVARVKYRQSHLSPCMCCGTLIRCDMYRHVVRCHLELAQLWRCPVLWCTVWKGTPQDLMDHIRGVYDVSGEIRKVSLETLFPPWTVTHQVYTDSLTSRHSGISNDVLLFSDIGLSLVHHYRVHKRGLPHVAFRRNYLSPLRTLLPPPTVLPIAGGSPDAACSTLPCAAESPNAVCASPRPSRRAIRRRRPVRVMESPVRDAPLLTVQDPLAEAGAVVLDCCPPLLPVLMDISGVDLSAIWASAMSAEAAAFPPEREHSGGGGYA